MNNTFKAELEEFKNDFKNAFKGLYGLMKPFIAITLPFQISNIKEAFVWTINEWDDLYEVNGVVGMTFTAVLFLLIFVINIWLFIDIYIVGGKKLFKKIFKK